MSPRVPPVGLLCAAAGAQVVVSVGARSTWASRIVGGVAGVGSFAVLAASVVAFRRNGTTVNPLDVDRSTTLVRSGLFRFTRNPMYVGMAGALGAHALYRRSPAAMISAALFVAAIDRWQIPAEEIALGELFGAEFEDYVTDVPRWLVRRPFRSPVPSD